MEDKERTAIIAESRKFFEENPETVAAIYKAKHGCTFEWELNPLHSETMKRGQGKRSGGMVMGSMAGRPEKFVLCIKVPENYRQEMIETYSSYVHTSHLERVKYCQAREYGCEPLKALVFALNQYKNPESET